MDVLSPSDPIERLIRLLPARLQPRESETRALVLALVGLTSFAFMGVASLFPRAYAHVSLLHLVIRAALCVALVSYIYDQLYAKTRRPNASPLKPTPTALSASSSAAPASPSGLPDYLLAHSEYSGAHAVLRELPVPEKHRPHNLIFGALLRDRMVERTHSFVHASFFGARAAQAQAQAPAKDAEAVSYPEVVIVYALGDLVCGHPSIVHGGLTAALLDQTLGAATFVAQPTKTCFTANLSVNYRKPLPAHTIVAVRCVVTRIEGRKLHATGRVELLSDRNVLFAEATALFVSPK